jgi:hypothetical protein
VEHLPLTVFYLQFYCQQPIFPYQELAALLALQSLPPQQFKYVLHAHQRLGSQAYP